jgi:hypothetical protein
MAAGEIDREEAAWNAPQEVRHMLPPKNPIRSHVPYA